jgi:hypothetical protein
VRVVSSGLFFSHLANLVAFANFCSSVCSGTSFGTARAKTLFSYFPLASHYTCSSRRLFGHFSFLLVVLLVDVIPFLTFVVWLDLRGSLVGRVGVEGSFFLFSFFLSFIGSGEEAREKGGEKK